MIIFLTTYRKKKREKTENEYSKVNFYVDDILVSTLTFSKGIILDFPSIKSDFEEEYKLKHPHIELIQIVNPSKLSKESEFDFYFISVNMDFNMLYEEVGIVNQKDKKQLKFLNITHSISYYLDEEGNKWQEYDFDGSYRRTDDDSIRLEKHEVEIIYHDFEPKKTKLKEVGFNSYIDESGTLYSETEIIKLGKGHLYSSNNPVKCLYETEIEFVDSFETENEETSPESKAKVKLKYEDYKNGNSYYTDINGYVWLNDDINTDFRRQGNRNIRLKEDEVEVIYHDFEQENDNVEHPSHYTQNKIECIDYIRDSSTRDEFIGYCTNNAKKYIHRWKDKNGVEDIKKAIKHLEWLVKYLED